MFRNSTELSQTHPTAAGRWLVLAVGGLLFALAFAVYGPYLGNALVFDDVGIFNGTTIYDYAVTLWRTQVRWISYASLAHIHMFADGNIVANRVGNLLLHAGNAIAVFVLLNQLLALSQREGAVTKPWTNPAIALLAAAVFAMHPVAVYGVGYLVQRSILMSTLFMLLMLIAWTRWLHGGRTVLWAWAVFWYACSVFSKEHSVAAPAVAILLAVTLSRPSMAMARRLLVPVAAMAAVTVLITLLAKGVLGVAYEPYGAEMLSDLNGADAIPPNRFHVFSVLTQTSLFFKYLGLWIYPDVSRMAIDVREPFATSIALWPNGMGAIAFTAYGAVALFLVVRGGRTGLVGWLLAYPLLMFLTELSTVRIQEPFVLYRAYLWFPVFGALPALLLFLFGFRFAISAGLVMVCIMVPLSWNRLDSMRDSLHAWEDAAKLIRNEQDIGAVRIYFNRAQALSQKGDKAAALRDLNWVIAQKPGLAPIRLARARLYYELRQYPQALEDVNASIQSDPKRSDAYYARAIILKRLDRDDEAKLDMRKGCELGDHMACFVSERNAAKEKPGR